MSGSAFIVFGRKKKLGAIEAICIDDNLMFLDNR